MRKSEAHIMSLFTSLFTFSTIVLTLNMSSSSSSSSSPLRRVGFDLVEYGVDDKGEVGVKKEHVDPVLDMLEEVRERASFYVIAKPT